MGHAVDAHQLGGYALPHLWVVVRLAHDGQSGVGMQVDEAGAHHMAGGVDGPGCFQVGNVAPLHGDRVAFHQHRGEKAGAAGAVDHQAVSYQEVNHRLLVIGESVAG